jgi:hypothetical protein
MLKRIAAIFVCASTLALLVGIFQYEPPVGSNIEKVQRDQGQNQKCPPGKTWNGSRGVRMCQ